MPRLVHVQCQGKWVHSCVQCQGWWVYSCAHLYHAQQPTIIISMMEKWLGFTRATPTRHHSDCNKNAWLAFLPCYKVRVLKFRQHLTTDTQWWERASTSDLVHTDHYTCLMFAATLEVWTLSALTFNQISPQKDPPTFQGLQPGQEREKMGELLLM